MTLLVWYQTSPFITKFTSEHTKDLNENFTVKDKRPTHSIKYVQVQLDPEE